MENKVENINIETNTELFEYEMTEVILKLKGEFAAFSGKDTKFAEMVVDDAKLRINTPEVVKFNVEGRHVAPPAIGYVQQTKTACIKVKETVLQLPVIPQISNDDGRKEEEAIGSRKTNVWQGIAVPDLHPFSEITITKESSKKSLEETEREIVSSVEVPQLISVVERTHDLKKKKYVEPVKVQVPSSTIKCNVWNKDKSTTQVKKRTLGKSVPDLKYIQTYKTDDVCIKHQIIAVPDAPKCNNIRKNVDIKSMQLGVVLPNADISRKMNVKTVVVSGIDALQVPNILVVKKTYIPDIQEKGTAISVSNKMIKVASGIPDIASEISSCTVCVPAVSFKKHKPLSVGKVEQHNIEIPVATKPVFSGVALVEHELSNTEIEIPPLKVTGNLDKVVVSHHGTIIIPQKPEVKETVDKIITLAVAKR